jgi:foldase protein PrsA
MDEQEENGMRNIKLLWGVIGLLLLIIIVQVIFSKHFPFQPTTELNPEQKNTDGDRVVAKIGDHEIKFNLLEQNVYTKHAPEMVNQMLDRYSIQLEADALGMKLQREEIDQELMQMQQGYDSEAQFYKSMKEQIGMTKEELREDVYYKLLLERIATRNIEITDKQIDAYIKAHPDEFKNNIQLRMQLIRTNSMEQANKVLELLKSGRDFEELARERSLDTVTANDGGDLGWVEENDPFIPASFIKVGINLKINEVSKPIEMDSGYAIIKLKDRKESSKGGTEQIKERVRKQLALQQAPPLKEFTQMLRNKRNAVILDPQLKL